MSKPLSSPYIFSKIINKSFSLKKSNLYIFIFNFILIIDFNDILIVFFFYVYKMSSFLVKFYAFKRHTAYQTELTVNSTQAISLYISKLKGITFKIISK